MGAEMISYPNTKLMCSVNVDGSAAAVLASESAGQAARPDEPRRPRARLGDDLRPLHAPQHGHARLQRGHPNGGQGGLRDGRRRARGRRPGRAARLLRDRRDRPLREPWPLRRRRRRPADRHRRDRARRPRAGQRLGRPAVQGPSRWARPASPTSTRSPSTCAAKPARARSKAPASALPTWSAWAPPAPSTCSRSRSRAQRPRRPNGTAAAGCAAAGFAATRAVIGADNGAGVAGGSGSFTLSAQLLSGCASCCRPGQNSSAKL